jgi:hypothetical protein
MSLLSRHFLFRHKHCTVSYKPIAYSVDIQTTCLFGHRPDVYHEDNLHSVGCSMRIEMMTSFLRSGCAFCLAKYSRVTSSFKPFFVALEFTTLQGFEKSKWSNWRIYEDSKYPWSKAV